MTRKMFELEVDVQIVQCTLEIKLHSKWSV